MNTKNIDDNKVFDRLIYAQCWEDPEIDRKAFRIGPDDTIFSIPQAAATCWHSFWMIPGILFPWILIPARIICSR